MTPVQQLRLVVLGSGSTGNASAITDGETTVLIDCGFSAKETHRRMVAAGLNGESVTVILLTHEHSDHVKGVEVFARRYAGDCPVYGTRGTLDAADSNMRLADSRVLRPGDAVRIGGLSVLPFRTSHDASEPLGYRIETDFDAIGIATDTGLLTDEIAEALQGCGVIALEANHDIDMLERGPYPAFLKRRIASVHGHLSNHAAADGLERLMSDRLRHFIGMHRSRTNNTARLAETALRQRASRIGCGAKITVAAQDGGCDTQPPQGQLFAD